MVTTDCECIVIGAGVVGLAIAARLAAQGRDVLILEREPAFGTVTSARNSEVIHAGIYYAASSHKARLCVRGREALYRYCAEHHVTHARCGKLIVATTPSQCAELASIQHRAQINGVDDIRLLDASAAVEMEPELECLAALYSPSTGIIDSHGLMLSLLGAAQDRGASLATHSAVQRISRDESSGHWQVEVVGEDCLTLSCRTVINAGGHDACRLAASAQNTAGNTAGGPVATAVLSKGNYFRLAGRSPFSRLIYPVPEPGGLGVHITLDLAGQARFGPDVEPVTVEDYSVDPARADRFYAAVRAYWPGLPDNALTPDYAGIRPKVRFGDTLCSDFVIQSALQHGRPGLVNLMGIESPGLTACLALAEDVASLVAD